MRKRKEKERGDEKKKRCSRRRGTEKGIIAVMIGTA
jgi:hypothetical protein